MESWSDMLQDVGKLWATSAIQQRYTQPFEIQKMQLAAFGPMGQPYVEGQAGMGGSPVVQAAIPTSWLLIGGIVALVVFMGD